MAVTAWKGPGDLSRNAISPGLNDSGFKFVLLYDPVLAQGTVSARPLCRFVVEPGASSIRTPEHVRAQAAYPDPQHYFSHVGEHFFRHRALRHLRVERFNRYPALMDVMAPLRNLREHDGRARGIPGEHLQNRGQTSQTFQPNHGRD